MSNKQEIIFDDGEEIRPQMFDPVQIERALDKVGKDLYYPTFHEGMEG